MAALTEHRSFLSDILTRQNDRRRLIDPNHAFQPQPAITGYLPRQDDLRDDMVAGPSKRRIVNYVKEEETVRNDLSGWYIQSGEFGSNHIHGAAEHEICEEYPALRRLMDLKAQHVDQHSLPPLHLPLSSTSSSDITSALGSNRFDVILLRPLGTWQETAELPIRSISADPGFVFLWVGKGDEDGLERGRECFAKWGFRRAEDIVWVKTNRLRTLHGDSKDGSEADGSGGGGLFASSKEHCLMGIRGTVRRSTDSRFVHCNVDTDIIVHEPTSRSDNKTAFPPYLYTLIENFCLGARRLELFGDQSTARRGWVTASLSNPHSISPVTENEHGSLLFDPTTYPTMIPPDPKPVVPFHPEIDQLRPKSPVRRGGGQPRGGHQSQSQGPGPGPGQGQGQRYGSNQNQYQYQNQNLHNQSRPPPTRFDNTRNAFQQYQQHPPHQYHQSYSNQYQSSYPQQMDPMQLQLQMQMQMQMQIQQAQMMAMMDPMMMAQAQTQAQAEAQAQFMQMQMQLQAMQHGQGTQGMGQGYQIQYPGPGHTHPPESYHRQQGYGTQDEGGFEYTQTQHEQWPQGQGDHSGPGWGWHQ